MLALGEALGAEPRRHERQPRRRPVPCDESIAAAPGAGRLLLVVDQLEELFAQASADDQARFIAALTEIHDLDASRSFSPSAPTSTGS